MPNRIKIPNKIEGGALYYVIFLLFLLTILLTSYILFIHYKNILFTRQVAMSQLDQNIESAIEVYQTNPDIIGEEPNSSVDIFKDFQSNISINQRFWGVYKILRFEAKYKELKKSKLALFGNAYGSEPPFALYMTDKNRYLSVCGNSVIKGRCYLPKLGFRTSRMEGILFTGVIENRDDYILESNTKMPSPPQYLLHNARTLIDGNMNGNNKKADYLIGKNELFNSFTDSLLVINANDSIWRISNVSISGQVILHSFSIVEIDPSAQLQNSIVVARKIIVKNGFKGHLQLFASDSIIVESNVNFDYPSNICVVGNNPSNGFIKLGTNSQVNGAVWLWNEVSNEVNPPELAIENDAVIRGQVYCPGKTIHKGTVVGSLIADLFKLNTSYAYYENYIFNATIDSEKLPLNFACLPLVFDYNEMQFIDWVH